MVVPFAPGGSVDGNARTLAQRIGEILGQQVVVENIGGAGGMTGSNRVARAAPDGYQLLMGTSAPTASTSRSTSGRSTMPRPTSRRSPW